jgi:uncharacterized protein
MRLLVTGVVIAAIAGGCAKRGRGIGPAARDGGSAVGPGATRAAGVIDAAASAAATPAAPDAGPPPAPQPLAGPTRAAELTDTGPIASGELDLVVGTRHVGATLVKPAAAGTWPAMLLMAGSGPTDRDWNSPMLAAKNGSGKLLAEWLAHHGVVVIRWDKTGSGHNGGPPIAELSLDTFRDEGAAALAAVRARPDVRRDAIFVAGHSEGGVHAMRLAELAGGDVRGVVFLSAPGRRMVDIIGEQLEGNLRDGAHFTPDSVAAQMKPIRKAFADFLAGRPVDARKVSDFPQVQQLITVLVRPETATLVRALFGLDPAAEAAHLPQRDVFVAAGGKDVQVDPERDGRRLVAALEKAGKQVTFHRSPDMDHVLKHEPHTVAEIRADLAAAQAAYNADDRVLDGDFTAALLAWLVRETQEPAPP